MLPTLLAVSYGLANFTLMMWIGFEGLRSWPPYLQTLPVIVTGYVLLWFILIYVILYKASLDTRNVVRYAVFVPWGFLLLFAIPQVSEEPRDVLMICIAGAYMWFQYVPGELYVRWVRG